ncbi:uncharacterized protein OCT59_011571 [Rhizophagus irregularis]|uniref:uncharacterized protein n=1 Tax=Rhizophagus irregularis TaxID=588596 RepID=UPI00331BB941|nr:hypothetical protein OCT59_011571 [Rhizophagus irregularis]
MSDNSVIEVNDDDNKIEIEVDKIDVDKIDFDKIDDDKNDDKNDSDQIDIDKIDVDKTDADKIFTFDDEPHNSNSITMVEISPKEKCLIIYSEEKRSIVSWNVKDIDKVQLKFHQTVEINENNEDNEDKKYEIESLCVSDDKKLAYINCIIKRYNNVIVDQTITVIDMNYDKYEKITLSFDKNAVAKIN